MSITGLLVALILIITLMAMAALSTSMVFAASQLISHGLEVLFDLNRPTGSHS